MSNARTSIGVSVVAAACVGLLPAGCSSTGTGSSGATTAVGAGRAPSSATQAPANQGSATQAPATQGPATQAPATTAARTPAAAGSTVDPCTFLTPADLNAVFGGTASDGFSALAEGPDGAASCTFDTQGSVLGLGGGVLVVIDSTRSPADIGDGQDGAPVAGLGAPAEYSSQYNAPVLTFAKDGAVIDLELGAPHLPASQTPADVEALMTRLGKAAATHG